MVAQFRRFNVGTISYAHYDVAVVDRITQTLVFVSTVGYTTTINQLAKEVNKINNVYLEGPGYVKNVSNGYEVEKRRQNNSDFMHMVAFRKDVVTEESNGDERLVSYIYCKNSEEKISRLYDKLYKYTAVPLLREWIPYLITQMERDNNLRQVVTHYDTTKAAPFQCYCLNITKNTLARMVSNGLNVGIINVNGTNVNSDRMTEIVGLDSYLNSFGEVLATKIQESFVPKFVPGESSYDEPVDDYDDSCYDAGIEIYEAQKTVIQSSVNNLDVNDVTFVIGEMGTGKTLIGSGISYSHHAKHKKNGLTAAIMCPSHLVNKWKREVERFVPNGKAYIVRTMDQILALDKKLRDKKRKENMYLIVSKETAKFGYEMRPAVNWSRSKNGFCCPECGKPLQVVTHQGTGRNRRTVVTFFGKRDMAKMQAHNQVCENKVRYWDDNSKSWAERSCGAKLWTPLNRDEDRASGWVKLGTEGWIRIEHVNDLFEELSNTPNLTRKDAQFLVRLSEKKIELDRGDEIKSSSKAPRKYPIAKYIKDNYTGLIDYLLADELHLYKGDTEQGQAFGDLAASAKKLICLTGTLLNGYADGLFYILYRTLPGLMQREGFGYKDEANFMRAFGVIKKTNRFRMTNGREGERVGDSKEKRLPGVSPLVFTKFLLENAVFLSLSDMAEGLPPYEEIPMPIAMDEELRSSYQNLEQELRRCMGGRDGAGVKAMGALLQSLSVYPDMPYNQPPVIHPDSGEVLVVPPELPRGLRRKENELLELIQRKIENEERVLVYYQWTNRTDLSEKLTNMLVENNIQTAVLESKVAADKREEWIEQRMNEGVQVVICNPTLVETGLDLLGFTTIVFYQVGYNIFTMRQASRRSWRLGQEHPIEVYFMFYEGTIQEQALSLMATKLQASMAIEGRFSEEGLRAMSNNEDLLTQIANSVVQGIQHTVDAGAFRAVAKTTTAVRQSNRVRKRKKDLEFVPKKHITLSYLLRKKIQEHPVTSTQQIMLEIFQGRNHVGNIY